MTLDRRTPLTLVTAGQWGRSGKAQDVDRLMAELEPDVTFTVSRLVDYALGLVASREGRERLRHYLCNGNPVQRNYAALYFKRRGLTDFLDEAVRCGCIDAVQAYAQ